MLWKWRRRVLYHLKNGNFNHTFLWSTLHRIVFIARSFTFQIRLDHLGEGNDNPLQYSCMENPRDGGGWWAAIYGVAQSQTWLKWLSSSSSSSKTGSSKFLEYSAREYRGIWKCVAKADNATRNNQLPTKVCLVKAMVFPVVMYGCESWTIKKAEHWRIDAFEL